MHPQLERCYDLAIKGAWHHPFFLIPLGHCEWHEAINSPETEKIETMAVVARLVKEGRDTKPVIDLYINTEWVQGLPDDEIFGVLAHEMLHPALHHHERGGGKNQEIWGQAADMAINASLVQSGIKLPKTGLLPPHDHYEDSADELYALLEANEIPKPKSYDPNKVGQGCMPRKSDPNAGKDGDEEGDQEGQEHGDQDGDQEGQGNGNGPGGEPGDSPGQGESQSDQGSDRAWGEMIAQAQSMSRGTGSAKVMARLFKPKPIKTQWDRLLKRVARRANASGGRDNQTFTRINRRSFDSDFTLPGWKSNRPAIAAIIDSSGSVSDEMLRASITSVYQCAKASGVRVFLAIHASDVYYADWISPETTVESISSLCTDRGGTDPNEAFEKVSQAKGRFDACVYLTDGEVGRYPDKPQNVKHMIVGIVGDRQSTYRATMPDGWQEIDVEVKVGE